MAEVSWADGNGVPVRTPATIEDISVSGACLRLKAPIGVGSRVMVRWHREQFAAVARNCRSDGLEFLLGVRRELGGEAQAAGSNGGGSNGVGSNGNEGGKTATGGLPQENQPASQPTSAPSQTAPSLGQPPIVKTLPAPLKIPASAEIRKSGAPAPPREQNSPPQTWQPRGPQPELTSSTEERNPMQPKKLLPNFWRRPQTEDAPEKSTEVAMSKPKDQASEPESAPPSELLSYEDIYHAAGIMAPRSGYGIHKVVEMLNSDRIRDLSKEIKRASVLMALDAAGAAVEELLRDARERKHALDAYEERQRKQAEEFEARKTDENARIQAEMERVTAHYAERIQRNRDLVAREKEVLHNWQMAKQNESQRIDEVMDVCAKQPAAAAPPSGDTMAAAAGAHGGEAAPGVSMRPTLLPEVSKRN